ncbi:unnamed protein product, partial [Pseudo-nitzschia multistriata]
RKMEGEEEIGGYEK